MRNAPPTPNLPPLSSIKDPDVRQALQALYEAHRVRSGETGTGEHRFLTARDLNEATREDTNMRGGAPGSSQVNQNRPWLDTAWLNNIIRKVEDAVKNSRMWKELSERIDWIELPEWFTSRFGAMIRTEVNERKEGDRVVAQQVTTAVARIDNNIALARDEIKVVADLAGVSASRVTTLQNDVNGVRTSAQQALSLATSVDGRVKGTWQVKFDYDGYITGAGLGLDAKGGSASSIFLIRADRFAVGSPQHPNIPDHVAFTVQTVREFLPDGTVVEPGIYLNRAFIRFGSIMSAEIGFAAITESKIQDLAVTTAKIVDANITTAKIQDLAVTTAKIRDLSVETLKIAGEAVIVPYSAEGGAGRINLPITIPWTGGPATRVVITHFGLSQFGSGPGDAGPNYGTMGLRIGISGNGLDNVTLSETSAGSYGSASTTHMGFATLGAGVYTVHLDLFGPGGNASVQRAVILAAKR